MKSYMIFLIASLAISIGLQMVLPFPYGLGAALAIFIAFPLMLRKRYMTRMRGYGGDSTGSGGFFGFSQKTGGLSHLRAGAGSVAARRCGPAPTNATPGAHRGAQPIAKNPLQRHALCRGFDKECG